MRLLRLCSVFETPQAALERSRGFDAIGGMQVHTARLTEALDARGFEQTVVTAHRPGAPRRERVGERAWVIRTGAPVRRLRQLYGVTSIPTLLAHERVDVVHAHLGEDIAVPIIARVAAASTLAPIVATVHCSIRHTLEGHDARSRSLRAVGAPLELALLRRASAVLVLDDATAERLERDGIPGGRIAVVPLGVDVEALAAPRPRPAAIGERPTVVFIGRLVREKGVHDLVAAFACPPLRGARLVIVGDGPEREALVAGARALGGVTFVGSIPNAEVAGYLQHADVVAVPSWFEERGRVVLEAMAAGTPVVGTRTGGIRASIEDGVTGLLVEPRDPLALSRVLARVLLDDLLARRLREAARDLARTHDVAGLVAATTRAYEETARRSPRPVMESA